MRGFWSHHFQLSQKKTDEAFKEKNTIHTGIHGVMLQGYFAVSAMSGTVYLEYMQDTVKPEDYQDTLEMDCTVLM